MKEIRGTSGAKVKLFGEAARKEGPPGPIGDRVTEQGKFLMMHPNEVFVHVYFAGKNFYQMERLEPYQVEDIRQETRRILYYLYSSLWFAGQPREQRSWDTHLDYVHSKANRLPSRELILEKLNMIREGFEFDWLTRVTTHGDPTFDNLMLAGRGPVLTDPIPASDKMPDVMASDVAKVVQSLTGYEVIKFGVDREVLGIKDALDLVYDTAHELFGVPLPLADRAAIHYFTAVHYLRLIPYQPPELQVTFEGVLQNVLRRV